MGFSCDMASGIEGSVVQLVRMLPCHGRGRGFESRPVRKNVLNFVQDVLVYSYVSRRGHCVDFLHLL